MSARKLPRGASGTKDAYAERLGRQRLQTANQNCVANVSGKSAATKRPMTITSLAGQMTQ
jgi:hypothetical protein